MCHHILIPGLKQASGRAASWVAEMQACMQITATAQAGDISSCCISVWTF